MDLEEALEGLDPCLGCYLPLLQILKALRQTPVLEGSVRCHHEVPNGVEMAVGYGMKLLLRSNPTIDRLATRIIRPSRATGLELEPKLFLSQRIMASVERD